MGDRITVSIKAQGTTDEVLRRLSAAGLEVELSPQAGYEALLQYAADAITVADLTGRYVAANDRAGEMFGYSHDEFLTLNMRDIEPSNSLADDLQQLEKAGPKKPVLAERMLRRKDGSLFPAEISAVVLPDGNLLGILRDISLRKQAEQKLRESEERYRQMFTTNPAVKFVLDPATGRIIDANPAACEYYGYSLEELVQKRVFDINVMPEAEVRAEMEAAVRENRLYFVFQHRLASDELRWVEVYTGPLTIDGQQYLHSIVHDITERKNAEEKLKQSEQYYRSLIENASDLITIMNGDGMARYVSPSVRRLLGYEPEKVLGGISQTLVHPDDDPETAAEFATVLETPGAIKTREIRIRHQDGSWRYFEATATNLLHDPIVQGIVINSRDITARKLAEEALHERTHELERLNQFMVDRELRMVELKKEIAELRAELAANKVSNA